MATPPPPLTTMATGKPPVHTVISVKVSVFTLNHFIICHHFHHHFNHHSSSSSIFINIHYHSTLYLVTKLDIQPRYTLLMLKQEL